MPTQRDLTRALRNPYYDKWRLAYPPEWDDEADEADEADDPDPDGDRKPENDR